MTIRPVRAELFHVYRRTDRQTDTTNPIVAFQSPFLCVVSVTMRKYPSNQAVSAWAHTELEWAKNMVLEISLTR